MRNAPPQEEPVVAVPKSDEKKIGNTCVGLTMYETKLCLRKMKQMGWKPLKKIGG